MTLLRFSPLALLLAVLVGCGGGGPADVAESFTRAAANGDGEAVVEMLDPAMAQTFGPKIQSTISMQAGQISSQGGLDDINILEETVNGNNATVRLETVMGDGTREEQTIQLRLVDGDWKVAPTK